MKTTIAAIKSILPLSLILILAIWFMLPQINKPFYGYHDWNGVTYGQIARNYVRYGLATRLGQVENLPTVGPDEFRYDTHFPPLFTMLLSLPVALFGPQEWAIRSLPLVLSLISLYLIYRIGESLQDRQTGWLAALLALFTPIFIYFGKNPVHENLALLFLLLDTYLFRRVLVASKQDFNRAFITLAATATLSLFVGWPTYYHLPLMALLGLMQTRRKEFALFFLLPFATLALHFLHVRFITGSFTGGGLGEIIGYRLGLTSQKVDTFTVIEFIQRMLLWSRNMFGIPLLLAAGLGFLTAGKNRIYLLVLATGIAHPIIFSNAGWLHDYLQFPFLGFVALAAALFLTKVFRKYAILAGIILAVINLGSKWPFTQAMINSYMSQPEYDLVVTKIQPLTRGESLILPAQEARLLSGVVTPYYLQLEVNFIDGPGPQYQVTRLADELVVEPLK